MTSVGEGSSRGKGRCGNSAHLDTTVTAEGARWRVWAGGLLDLHYDIFSNISVSTRRRGEKKGLEIQFLADTKLSLIAAKVFSVAASKYIVLQSSL